MWQLKVTNRWLAVITLAILLAAVGTCGMAYEQYEANHITAIEIKAPQTSLAPREDPPPTENENGLQTGPQHSL